ncbi:DUF4333 domain-containing protein [Nocardioides lijunqiniae]|uniref:DUF4333 domain-containing protein n=1 Tax=Nocardioides lijunqiniae TaxID=2760832 RepID=UPI001878B964|nr:DUF4333 domain-containing protein [Nocardioides lijunqiniae]
MRLPSRAGAGLACLVVLTLSACSADDGTAERYDADEVAGQVADAQREVAPQFDVERGSCPEGEELAQGASFDCTVVVGGAEATYTVTVESVSDGEAELAFTSDEAVMSAAGATDLVEEDAEDRGYDEANASCGETEVLVGEPGDVITCTVAADGEQYDVDVEILDLDGAIQLVT